MQEALEQISRRGFIQLGAGALALTGGGTTQQLSNPIAGDGKESPIGLDDDVDGAGVLVGPLENRPDPDDPLEDYFDQWETYHFVYFATTNFGGISWIKHTDPQWRDIMSVPTNQLNEVETQEGISFFNNTFARPEAPDTKNWTFTPADITKQSSEVELAATTVLETSQRGNYPPGSEAIPGVGWRVTDTPTAGEALAGYFDDDDGGGVGEDATDSFVFLQKDGTRKKVYRTDWNGFIPDDRLWVNNRPVVTRFPHLFYGGGDFRITALVHGEESSSLETLHTFTPVNVDDTLADGAPMSQPNLPVRFESSSLAGGSVRANACHYQISLDESERRVNGEHFRVTGIPTTGWTPLLSWRKRTNWEMVNVKPLEFTVYAATNDLKLELQLGAVLTGASFGLPTHTSSAETAVEIDTAGSIDTNGERRAIDSVTAGQGSKFGGGRSNRLQFNLGANRVVTLAAQADGGQADAFGHLEWREFF